MVVLKTIQSKVSSPNDVAVDENEDDDVAIEKSVVTFKCGRSSGSMVVVKFNKNNDVTMVRLNWEGFEQLTGTG